MYIWVSLGNSGLNRTASTRKTGFMYTKKRQTISYEKGSVMKIFIITAVVLIVCALIVSAVFLLRRIVYNLIDRRIERFQSELIEKQVREIENMYKQVRGWRHDYRNHIQNMKIQLAEGNYDKLNSYLDGLTDDLNTVDTVIKTGNVMADAILNSKLSVAEKLNIALNVKAYIPSVLPLSDVELCAVMGNLLDNAVEACAKLPESERFMRIYIGTLKNQFYLSVQNAAGEVKSRAANINPPKRRTRLRNFPNRPCC